MRYIIYSTSWGKEPVFYGAARTIWDAESLLADLIDESYINLLDKAINNAIEWLNDLSEYKWCTWAPYDIYVDRKHGDTVYYDEMEDLLIDVDYHTYGQSIADYINAIMPNYKIGTTI